MLDSDESSSEEDEEVLNKLLSTLSENQMLSFKFKFKSKVNDQNSLSDSDNLSGGIEEEAPSVDVKPQEMMSEQKVPKQTFEIQPY